MYNGIGLTTPRGSGTNGYVQRNLSSVNVSQTHQKYKTDEEVKKAEAIAFRGPNTEILAHQRKRQIELQCVELEDLMEEQGFTPEEIEEKVALYRKSLQHKHEAEEAKIASGEITNPKALIFGTKLQEIESDTGGSVLKNSHEIAAAKLFKNAQFKEALRLDKDYVDGTSLQRAKANQMKKAEEEMNQKAKEVLQKEFLILEDSSSSDSDSNKSKEKKKSKKTKEKHKKAQKQKKTHDDENEDEKNDSTPRKKPKKQKTMKGREFPKEDNEKDPYSASSKHSQYTDRQTTKRARSSEQDVASYKGRRPFEEDNGLSDHYTSGREQENSRLIRSSATSRTGKNQRSPSSSSSEGYDNRYKDHNYSSRDRENHLRRTRGQYGKSQSPPRKCDSHFTDARKRNMSPIRQDESRFEKVREDDRDRHFSHRKRSPPPSSYRNLSSVGRRGRNYEANVNSPHSGRRSRSMSPLTEKRKPRRSRSRSRDRRK